MDIARKLSILSVILTCSLQAEFEARAPVDYKEEAKNSFGSLIKGNGKKIIFGESSSGAIDEKSFGEDIKAKKATQHLSEKDKIWSATLVVLKDFPISFMDKKTGKVETEKVQVEQFDGTGTCFYKIIVIVSSNGTVTVTVLSDEDSRARLESHGEAIKSKILAKSDSTAP
ncbi:MAG: hypothetical protein LBB34_00295 [Holosporales bacterium]|jgi:hypothetical protein|nr:hypothetical protein [Holosporales bacterium]